MNNYFYDLPIELTNRIYEMDMTYIEIYDRVVNVIKQFPFFYKMDQKYYIFLKEYNFNFTGNILPIEEHFSVSKKYSFKKAIFIIIRKVSKPNTFLSNN